MRRQKERKALSLDQENIDLLMDCVRRSIEHYKNDIEALKKHINLLRFLEIEINRKGIDCFPMVKKYNELVRSKK